MARPHVRLLSKERIADGALEMIDSGEAFSMNALAKRLGVRGSSLYNHVEHRDALIELIRARLVEKYLSVPEEGSWDQVVEQSLRADRRMYADHPFVVPLLVGKTMTERAVIVSYDHIAEVLLDAGFPRTEILTILTILDAFALGFGLESASPDDFWQPDIPTATLGDLVAEGDGARRSDEAFEIALAMIIDSLRQRLALHSPSSSNRG